MKYQREKWWHYWYGCGARIDAIWHWLRGHEVVWYSDPETIDDGDPFLRGECKGDIVCNACPDTDNKCEMTLWCRWRWKKLN
jgi:hypothetical protein